MVSTPSWAPFWWLGCLFQQLLSSAKGSLLRYAGGSPPLPLLQIFAQFTFPMTLPHHPVWNSSLLPHHCPPSASIMSPLSSNTLLHVLESKSNSKHIFIPFPDLSVIIEVVESNLIIQILSNIIHIWWGKSSLLLSFYNILLVFLSFYSSLTLKVLCHVLKEKKNQVELFYWDFTMYGHSFGKNIFTLDFQEYCMIFYLFRPIFFLSSKFYSSILS